MNKNIRRKNSTLPVTADMKYNFSIGFKAIFLSRYIDREILPDFRKAVFLCMKTDREITFVGDPIGKFNFPVELHLSKICLSVTNFLVDFVILLSVFIISLTVSYRQENSVFQ